MKIKVLILFTTLVSLLSAQDHKQLQYTVNESWQGIKDKSTAGVNEFSSVKDNLNSINLPSTENEKVGMDKNRGLYQSIAQASELNKDKSVKVIQKSNFVVEKDGHPSLMFSTDEIDKIKARTTANPWLTAMYQTMLDDSKKYMNDSFIPFTFVKSSMYSMGTAGRALGGVTMNLLFTGYLEENMAYINRAKDIMFSAIRNTKPGEFGKEKVAKKGALENLNEQMKKGIPQFWRGHLQNGDAALSMVLAYDLLYPFMTKEEIKEYKTELREMADWLGIEFKGLFSQYNSTAMGCNHTSVHYGPVGLIALALGKEEPHYNLWLEKSKKYIEKYMTVAIDEDGYIMEGQGYGSYGVSGVYPLAHALKREKGPDHEDWFTEYKTPFFSKYGDQLLWKLLPNDDIIVFNDGRNSSPGEMGVMGALLNKNQEQLWAWLKSDHFYSKNTFSSVSLKGTYFRHYLFLHDPLQPKPANEKELGLNKHFESGRVIMRSGWNNADDAVVGFTSGRDESYAHNHDDENNVTFFALGTDFLFDAEYEARYSYCHSIPSIGGIEQTYDRGVPVPKRYGTMGKIQKFEERKQGGFIQGEAADSSTNQAYFPQVVDYFNRKVFFVREAPYTPYLIFRDDIKLKSGEAVEYTPRYVTNLSNKISKRNDNNGVVISGGKLGGKALMLVYSGKNPVQIAQDDLDGKMITKSGKGKKLFNDYLKRISGKVTAVNPRLTTIVLPYTEASQLPRVEVSEQGDNIIYTLTYDTGERHIVDLSKDNITLDIKQ